VMKTLRKLLSSGRCIALLNQNGKQGRIATDVDPKGL
jgi:hypothetical protein